MTSRSEMRERITRWVACHRDEMVELTRELVAIPSENPPGTHYPECVALLSDWLGRLDLDPRVVEVPAAEARGLQPGASPRASVLAGHGGGARTLFFHGHYDVVPALGRSGFSPRVEEGRLYGRGSADMKGGLAAMIYATAAVRECGVPLDGRLELIIVPDEETGGRLGAGWLVDSGLLARDGVGMLTAEPTSNVVWYGSRGALSLRVTVHGRPAHVALGHEGINAFEQMLRVTAVLSALKVEVEARITRLRIEPEAARRSILMLGGECSSGRAFNTVPGACSFTIDRRVNPEENFVAEKQRLLDVLDGVRREGVELEVEILQEGEPSASDESSPLARALAGAVATVDGRLPAFELCPGLLETRFYTRLGVPALGWGPGLLSVAHGPDEWVDIDRLVDCATIYAVTAAEVLGT